jgi:pyruvate dehydrogenase E1 component alpha subunit
MSDPAKYRTKEEVNRMRKERDPIDNIKEKLIKLNVSDEELKLMDKTIRDKVASAVEFAKQSEEPDPKELYTDVLI